MRKLKGRKATDRDNLVIDADVLDENGEPIHTRIVDFTIHASRRAKRAVLYGAAHARALGKVMFTYSLIVAGAWLVTMAVIGAFIGLLVGFLLFAEIEVIVYLLAVVFFASLFDYAFQLWSRYRVNTWLDRIRNTGGLATA